MAKGEVEPSDETEGCEYVQTLRKTNPAEYQAYTNSMNVTRGRTHFVKFFLDTSYYICIFPYKITETADEKYRQEKWFPQQVMCAIMHAIAIFDALTQFRQLDLSNIAQNPKVYFDIFTTCIHVSVIVAFCYTMWKKSDQFCELVTMVQKCPIISLWYPCWINMLLSGVAVLYLIIALISPIFMTPEEISNDAWRDVYESHVRYGRRSLFAHTRMAGIGGTGGMNNNDTAVLVASSSMALFGFPEVLFLLWSCFLQSLKWLYIAEYGLIMIVMSLTLYCATSYFINSLKQRSENCKLVMINYEALKSLSSVINNIIGVVTLTYTVDCIMYYATNIHSLITEGTWFSLFGILVYFLNSVAWLHFASYVCLMMDRFREYVREKNNRSVIPTKSISVILLIDEISTNVVAISGHGLFTVNYKFVAQALTTLMTYFIIVIQFKNVKSG